MGPKTSRGRVSEKSRRDERSEFDHDLEFGPGDLEVGHMCFRVGRGGEWGKGSSMMQKG
jgi:hypothetical protein